MTRIMDDGTEVPSYKQKAKEVFLKTSGVEEREIDENDEACIKIVEEALVDAFETGYNRGRE